jgi:ATP-dependent Lon protease
MLTAILSVLTGRAINGKYAMTGELNLRGEVMPIGGVKEKILAAKRNNIPHVILPHKNRHDLAGIEEVAEDISIMWANHALEVLEAVLMPQEVPAKPRYS